MFIRGGTVRHARACRPGDSQETAAPLRAGARLVRNVRAEVVELARSVGHEQVPAIYDQAIGDFYFR